MTPLAADPPAQAAVEDLSAAVLNGAWLDPVKFVLVAAWFLFTVRLIGTVAVENHRLRIHRSVWSFAVVVGSAVSLLPLLTIPFFPLGLFFAFGFFLPALLGYAHLARNPRVRPIDQILTDEHFARMSRELLSGLGVPVAEQALEGPVVRLKPPRSVTRRPESAAALGNLKTMLEEAVDARASDLQFDVLRDRASMRRRIDGVWGPATALELDVASSLADLLSRLTGNEAADARRPYVGSFPAKVGRVSHQFHIVGVSSVVRRRINVRLPSFSGPKKLADLGVGQAARSDLAAALRQSNGLILVCGPPSSGRRTTLQTMVGEIDHLSRRVLALDEPGRPFELPNTVDRFVVPIQAPTDPLWALRQAANVKCDVLLVGRIESGGAAGIVLEAAKERLVLAAVDADNVVAGIIKLIDLGADRDALSECLRGALGQRLPRKLCVDCREPYRPNAEALRRANLSRPVGDVLYRARPAHSSDCETCRDVGYVGCAAIFELLAVNARLRHLLRAGAGEREMLLEARKEGAVSPTEGALALLAAGETSADELRRVLQSARSERDDA